MTLPRYDPDRHILLRDQAHQRRIHEPAEFAEYLRRVAKPSDDLQEPGDRMEIFDVEIPDWPPAPRSPLQIIFGGDDPFADKPWRGVQPAVEAQLVDGPRDVPHRAPHGAQRAQLRSGAVVLPVASADLRSDATRAHAPLAERARRRYRRVPPGRRGERRPPPFRDHQSPCPRGARQRFLQPDQALLRARRTCRLRAARPGSIPSAPDPANLSLTETISSKPSGGSTPTISSLWTRRGPPRVDAIEALLGRAHQRRRAHRRLGDCAASSRFRA